MYSPSLRPVRPRLILDCPRSAARPERLPVFGEGGPEEVIGGASLALARAQRFGCGIHNGALHLYACTFVQRIWNCLMIHRPALHRE
jgi:hypothetical protein